MSWYNLISLLTSFKISSNLALIILDKFFTEISFGSCPFKPGIETISFSLFSDGIAEPNFNFNCSACFSIIEHPSFISFVIIFPPKGITAVCLMILSLKIAISVVPPPISTKTTPASLSSSVTVASKEAKGSKCISATLSPASLTHLVILFMAEI